MVPPLKDKAPAEQLTVLDSQFNEMAGLTVHVKTMGQAEPVFVLLDGFGASHFTWHAVMKPLSQNGMVIVCARQIFGLTDRPIELDG